VKEDRTVRGDRHPDADHDHVAKGPKAKLFGAECAADHKHRHWHQGLQRARPFCSNMLPAAEWMCMLHSASLIAAAHLEHLDEADTQEEVRCIAQPQCARVEATNWHDRPEMATSLLFALTSKPATRMHSSLAGSVAYCTHFKYISALISIGCTKPSLMMPNASVEQNAMCQSVRATG
jgi:hypothetical protein